MDSWSDKSLQATAAKNADFDITIDVFVQLYGDFCSFQHVAVVDNHRVIQEQYILVVRELYILPQDLG